MNEKDLQNCVLVFTNVMSEKPNYFVNATKYEFEVENGKGKIIDVENLLVDDISIQALCIKLVHNLSMLSCFFINYSAENDFDLLKHKFKDSDNFYLKLSVAAEDINIEKRKGFGLFGFNADDMAASLGEVPRALKVYISEIQKKHKKYDDLERVVKIADQIICGLDPNTAMTLFIKENAELYKKYID